MVHPSIQNLIFDLGGVILNLHVDRTHAAFARLANQKVEDVRTRIERTGFFNDYEKGLISDADFRNRVREFLSIANSDAEIDHAWNAMLGDIPAERLQLLTRLRKNYRVFLLSNTNQIHLDCFGKIVYSASGKTSLDPFFEKTYYSHLMKMRKPEPEIFEYVLNTNKLDPQSTLFLDDNTSNLTGAASIGIQTFHVKDPSLVLPLFS